MCVPRDKSTLQLIQWIAHNNCSRCTVSRSRVKRFYLLTRPRGNNENGPEPSTVAANEFVRRRLYSYRNVFVRINAVLSPANIHPRRFFLIRRVVIIKRCVTFIILWRLLKPETLSVAVLFMERRLSYSCACQITLPFISLHASVKFSRMILLLTILNCIIMVGTTFRKTSLDCCISIFILIGELKMELIKYVLILKAWTVSCFHLRLESILRILIFYD